MASKKLNFTILLFFIGVSVVLISIEISTHLNHDLHPSTDIKDKQKQEVKTIDSLDKSFDEHEIQLPEEMTE